MAEHYPRGNKELKGSFFSMHSPLDTMSWFTDRGVKLKVIYSSADFSVLLFCLLSPKQCVVTCYQVVFLCICVVLISFMFCFPTRLKVMVGYFLSVIAHRQSLIALWPKQGKKEVGQCLVCQPTLCPLYCCMFYFSCLRFS